MNSCANLVPTNLFIATGGLAYGYGGINPGVQFPFGALRLGPDTTDSVVDLSYRHFSGYNYADNKIRAFSHTHFVGAGVNGLGSIGIMPVLHKRNFTLSKELGTFDFWWSAFQKGSEIAFPGYYAVYLDEPKVQVELLALGRFSGIHQYTWSKTDFEALTTGLIVDVCHLSKIQYSTDETQRLCKNATISIDVNNPSVFRASALVQGGLPGLQWTYMYGEITSKSVETKLGGKLIWDVCTDHRNLKENCQVLQPESKTDLFEISSVSGTLFAKAKFPNMKHLVLDDNDNVIFDVRVGISFVSWDEAQLNLQSNLPNSNIENFDSLQKKTSEIWCEELSKISIESNENDIDIQTMLYTSFYRTMIGLTDYTESSGLYMGLDGSIHNVTAERLATYGETSGVNSNYQNRFISDLSLWDTFRTLNPWHFKNLASRLDRFPRTYIHSLMRQNGKPLVTSEQYHQLFAVELIAYLYR